MTRARGLTLNGQQYQPITWQGKVYMTRLLPSGAFERLSWLEAIRMYLALWREV